MGTTSRAGYPAYSPGTPHRRESQPNDPGTSAHVAGALGRACLRNRWVGVRDAVAVSRTAVLTDVQWARLAPLLPSSEGRRGRPFRDNRRVLEGIIYRYRCGLAWRDVPSEFGPWQTLWKRHRRYSGP
ncbi:hypothetical protein DMP15_27665 [Pseudonocardia sp. UM4_GMWB1]